MRLRETEIAVLMVLLMIIAIFCGIAVFGGKLYDRYASWNSARFYEANPPEENVFVPQYPGYNNTELDEVLAEPGQSAEVLFENGGGLPAQVLLDGVVYTDQHGKWNYCAPANLTMALSFWGETFTREVVGEGLKPYGEDKNVNAEELVAFVDSKTGLRAVKRVGGSVQQIKNLVASGFPVLIEKGEIIRDTSTGVPHWAGHYMIVIGYDDAREVFITRDSYYSPPDYDLDFEVPYAEMKAEWQHFNYVFVVVFPQSAQNDVVAALGNYADEGWAWQYAFEIARSELVEAQGVAGFFASFNLGENLLAMGDAVSAGYAFDEAFRIYANLQTDQRPWRVMWYRNQPYQAYYEAGRYQDVINLATTTIEATTQPYFEESWYWRGMAGLAMGDASAARKDFEKALVYNVNYQPAQQALSGLE